MVSGLMDAPYTRQYIGTLPYWYFVQQTQPVGAGLAAGPRGLGRLRVGAGRASDAPARGRAES